MEVHYFGMLAEAVGQPTEEIPRDKMQLSDLKEYLFKLHPELKNLSFNIAINHNIANNEAIEVSVNDEIALLPPFAGG